MFLLCRSSNVRSVITNFFTISYRSKNTRSVFRWKNCAWVFFFGAEDGFWFLHVVQRSGRSDQEVKTRQILNCRSRSLRLTRVQSEDLLAQITPIKCWAPVSAKSQLHCSTRPTTIWDLVSKSLHSESTGRCWNISPFISRVSASPYKHPSVLSLSFAVGYTKICLITVQWNKTYTGFKCGLIVINRLVFSIYLWRVSVSLYLETLESVWPQPSEARIKRFFLMWFNDKLRFNISQNLHTGSQICCNSVNAESLFHCTKQVTL